MKLVSLNGWGGKLHSDLLSYLMFEQPDVLCLQEVVHTPVAQKDWLTYRDGLHILPQRANFFRDVAKVFPNHTATFCPAAQGVLWDGNQGVASQWGLATFVCSSYPVIGQAQGFVHKDYSPDGYGDHPRSRSAHAVRIYDYSKNAAISVTHMHGLRDLDGKHDTPERDEQAHRLLALSDQVSGSADIRIICGDFNVEATSKTLGFLKSNGFEELVTANNFEGTRTSHYNKPGRFADYMLINSLEAVKRFDVVYAPEVSDHCPLVLEI
jgi:Endonuclease/Exonuclease/phosphatase family